MNQVEAIDELWKLNFFKEKRKTKDIEAEASKQFGVNFTNISSLLSTRKYLMDKKGWIQKGPPKREDEIVVHYFEPEKPRTSRKNFVDILGTLSGEVKICDPYFSKDSLEALEQLKNAKVKFLTRNKKENIKVSMQDLKNFNAENKNVELKGFNFDHLHDRYIICEDKIFILGHGFSIRNKESFIIELPKKFSEDLIQSLSSTFDQRWKNQQNTNLICAPH